MAVPPAKRARTGAEWGAVLGEAPDAALLAEVGKRNLSEAQLHAAVEASVATNYEVGKELGKGASASVYLVTHRFSGEKYAMKKIDKNGEMNDSDSMEAELQILRQLRHSGMVNLYEVFESSSTLWLVMELVEGGELHDYLVELDHFDETHVRDVAAQCCAALHYIHSSGVVHRDLKLENLLRAGKGPDAAVKIADFGLAARLPEFKKQRFDPAASQKRRKSGALTDLWGTPHYFAPELIDEAYGSQVDMWALGCILWELLTGHKCFGKDLDLTGPGVDADTAFWDNDAAQDKLYAEIRAGLPADAFAAVAGHLSADAQAFIGQLLCVDPVERLSAAVALKHPWIVTGAADGGAEKHPHLAAVQGKLKAAKAKVKQKLKRKPR